MKPATKTKLFRILFLLLGIVAAAYHVLADYYELDPRFLRPSPQGFAALVYYELGQYQRASEAWRSHYESDRTGIRIGDPFELADEYFVARDYSKAAQVYREVLQARPASVDAKLGLASILLMRGDHAESRRFLEDVLNRGVVEQRITTFLNFLTALDTLERAVPRAMTAERLLTLADAYRYLAIFDKRRLGQVLVFADKALALDPTLSEAFVSKGVVFGKQGDYPRSLEQFVRAARLHPTADTYRRVAGIASSLGRLTDEIEAYKEVVRLEPANAEYAYQAGEILLRKYADLYQASEYLRTAYELDPQYRAAAVWYAYSLERLGRHEEALTIYDAVTRWWSGDAEAVVLKAGSLISLKRYPEAIDLVLAAGRMRPLDFEAASDLGLAYSAVNDLDRAIAAYEQALRLKPYDVGTLYTLQALYRRRGRHQEAYDAVRAMLRLDPNHSGAQRLLPYVERNRPR